MAYSTREQKERTDRMVAMFRQGITLAKIGATFGVSRQCIQQTICRLGISRVDGGSTVVAAAKKERRIQHVEANSVIRYGFDRATFRKYSAAGLIAAWRTQRVNAKNRAIHFDLSFVDWIGVWETSGKLELRGRNKGKFCMSRIQDSGGYTLGNVHIQPCEQNSREAVAKFNHNKPNKGVFLNYPGTAKPWMARVGRNYLGTHATEADAVAARTAFLAERAAQKVAGKRIGNVNPRGEAGVSVHAASFDRASLSTPVNNIALGCEA